MYLYQKCDYEENAFEFAKEKYFNGFLDTRSVQENLLDYFRRMNISHPKLVGRSLRFPELSPK